MNAETEKAYETIRNGGAGFYEEKRGLIAVWGKEAVQFLDGMITNDMKTLADGEQILAAFPNAQGRLAAVVRVLRQGERFLIETEEATKEKLFQNLFRFTFAGDFFVEDISANYKYFELFGAISEECASAALCFRSRATSGIFVPLDEADAFTARMLDGGAVSVSEELFETLRIESGIPRFGVDMDENTIVPELGFGEMISYTKGCYIGQEIIARIHFRGHVAKQLTGLAIESADAANEFERGAELASLDGKPAGRVTSIAYSPKLGKTIALAFVRYDFLEPGTKLMLEGATTVTNNLPFLGSNI